MPFEVLPAMSYDNSIKDCGCLLSDFVVEDRKIRLNFSHSFVEML